jgi:hypothetical protein
VFAGPHVEHGSSAEEEHELMERYTDLSNAVIDLVAVSSVPSCVLNVVEKNELVY